MKAYARFLNELDENGRADLARVEQWRADRVGRYFAGKPFKPGLDASGSLRAAVADLLDQAAKRRRETRGTMCLGAAMQHPVSAKLEFVLGEPIEHRGFSTADAPGERKGDFFIGDVAVHVTSPPSGPKLSPGTIVILYLREAGFLVVGLHFFVDRLAG